MASAALIVVNYKTSTLAIDAIRTARAASSSPLQVIVVDNSVDPAEAKRMRPHADVLIEATENLGYGAAINRGRRAADAEYLIVCNPDVRFGAGAIDRLLEPGAAVAGPALFWDDACEWLLPPSELQTGAEVIDRGLASRWAAWARARDRRRIRERVAFWLLQSPTRMKALSGAILAIRSKAFDEAGGFDERFRLYFEENDFLRRVRGDVVYVPEARCRHIYNQSAGVSPAAADLYAASEEEYLRKWNGRWLSNAMKKIERVRDADRQLAFSEHRIDVPGGAFVEASPLATFETAAGTFPRSRAVSVPDEVWSAYRGDVLYLRVVDLASARILGTYARAKIPS